MLVPFTVFGIAVAVLVVWAIKEKLEFTRSLKQSSGVQRPQKAA